MPRDLEAREILTGIRRKVGAERQQAFEMLLENWEPWIVALARLYAPTRSDRHDYQQIGRLAILRAAERYVSKPGSGFEWYARCVVRNAMLDEAERDGRRRRRHRYLDTLDYPGTRSEGGLDRLLREETCTLVREELQRWNQRLREVVDLLFQQGHRQSEVARMLNRTPARVSQMMKEIRTTGKRSFALLGEDDG